MTDYPQLLKLSLYYSQTYQVCANRNTIKIYIGYLPISIQQEELRTAFQPYCEIVNIIIKKGNAQGTFDKFCYGFVTIACDEKKALEVITLVEKNNSNWKMKIKDEANEPRDRVQRPNNYNQYPPAMYPPPPAHLQHQGPSIQPHHHQMPHQMMQMPPPMQQPRQNYNYVQNHLQNDKGEIIGEKNNRIIVRELWLGGIPQLTDHNYMKEIMSRFGIVESTEIFPKFAFVKYKRAADAANAYEKASMIHQIFGSNSGFRISFSDPSRRKDIVANHYQFERNSMMLPILFLGFPPITSANIDLGHMHTICEKFGLITNYYMKKSTNSQMRSYFLFTFDNLKSAMKAKIQLSRRKDLLGEKRVQITLLLDENSVLQGHDFSYTQKNFVTEQTSDKSKRVQHRSYPQNNYQPNNGMQSNYPPPPITSSHAPQMIPPSVNPYNQGQQFYGHHSYNRPPYYPQQNIPPVEERQISYNPPPVQPEKQGQDVFNLLQSVLDDPVESNKKIPQKNQDHDNQNPSDIISKMLGGTSDPENQEEGQLARNQDHNKDREPDWAGFLTWRGTRRAGVDGYSVVGECQLADYNINVSSVMELDQVILKDRTHIMILQPTNSISQPVFGDYLKAFRKRAGVSVTKNWLIYLIGKTKLSESIHSIKENELLMIMEKSSLVNLIKDKTMPCDEIYFE